VPLSVDKKNPISSPAMIPVYLPAAAFAPGGPFIMPGQN
jgi:hypothetical protein